MFEKLKSSVVRIRAANGKVEGAGFLIAGEQVVTCAHVVAQALGLLDESQKPQANVHLDFPLIPSQHILTGSVICWQPPKPERSGDVTVLKLDDKLPDGAQTVELVRTDNLWGHRFRVFGFPPSYDDGVWASGVLRDRQAAGWVQIEMEESEYRVESGFSGAPVWDEQLNAVVGMIVATERRPDIKAAFMLPTTMLVDACQQINQALLTKRHLPQGNITILPATRTNSLQMAFALIPEGEFMMGSNESNGEKPVHKVTISKPFYLSIYPVTQREWNAVMKKNPSFFKGNDNLPIETVSWNDVQEFIKKLNRKEGTNKYRLPSEAEWEYAARAGTTTRYSFGDDESELDKYAWYCENSGSRPPKKGDKDDWFYNHWNGKTHPVGKKIPNLWGLYDMHGNVCEWVQDKCFVDYTNAPEDGSACESRQSPFRVLRGGSWRSKASRCRSASRHHRRPDIRGGAQGFRLLMDL